MDPIRDKILQLEQKADQLQKDGQYGQSLDVLEDILNLKKNAYGEDSEEYYKTSDKLCELCNLISMLCLQKERFEPALDFLKKAEILCSNSLKYKAITYNNLACFYRRTNKLRAALQFLQKALQIEISMEKQDSLADTHLNMCAVLSQLNHHQEALEHVLLSVVLLQEEFLEIIKNKQKQQDGGNKPNEENKNNQNDNQGQSFDQQNQNTQQQGQQIATVNNSQDRIAVLAIAYHNMGVELEYLKRNEECIQVYQKAVKFATENLGPQHQLVENLKNVLESAKQTIQNQRLKEERRKEIKSQGGQKKASDQLMQTYQISPSSQGGNRFSANTNEQQKLAQKQIPYSQTSHGFNQSQGQKKNKSQLQASTFQQTKSPNINLRPINNNAKNYQQGPSNLNQEQQLNNIPQQDDDTQEGDHNDEGGFQMSKNEDAILNQVNQK